MDDERETPNPILIGEIVGLNRFVRLEYRHLVVGAAANAVRRRHDVAQLLKCLEYVDADAAVVAGWLQQPQILFLMTALGYEHRTANILFVICLEFEDLLVYYLQVVLQ